MLNRVIVALIVACTLNSCLFPLLGAGTLGGFDRSMFPASKQNLVTAIDKLYHEFPEYILPEKWKKYDTWKERGYDFLDTRIFYFKTLPEEMYYVSFYGDANQTEQVNPKETGIAVRAVYTGTGGWKLEKDFKRKERERIIQRFDKEIVSKLESYTGTKAVRVK